MFQELVTNITNTSVFTGSFKDWIANLSINSIIIFIMMIFMIVGAVDKIRGNKKGYGEQFGRSRSSSCFGNYPETYYRACL